MRRRDRAPAATAAVLLAIALAGCGGREAVKDRPEPVWAESYTWGSFDELRMARYYLLEDVPDMDDVPADDLESPRGTYEFLYVEGPIDTDFGQCWAAVYREPG